MIACTIDVTNSSFCSVTKPIGRDRLMWRGRGAPRSLVKKEWIFVALLLGASSGCINDVNFDKASLSEGEGYPELNQQSTPV